MVVSEGAITNIMGGMENTAGVRLHSHRHKLKQRFDIIRKLGQGTYGKVQLAINKETGQEVAIKTIKKAKIETEQDLVRIRREIQIMSSVQHPQIIHIYEVFENREKMVLVMEFAAGGELYDFLSEKKVLTELEARRVFRHVASAVYYCHKHKICHRDLKLENILLDLEGNAKIADFGLANVFDEKHRLDTFCGSPLYASPEIVKGVPYIGPEVDCWSLGVLLYTLVYGAMPFDGSNFRRLVKQITQGDFYEPSTPASASELIRHMLTVQSTERATIEDICNHWWVNDGYPESCLVEAETLANLAPVRLDLLLSLAPKHISSEHLLIQPDDEDNLNSAAKATPDLHIPPPPPQEAENEVLPPPRSHSMGSLTPGSRLDLDLMLERKKLEKKTQEDKKRPNEELQPVEKRKKKESARKKSPASRPISEESGENKTVKKDDSKVEDTKAIQKNKDSSVDIEESTGAKKRDLSLTRKSPIKKPDMQLKEATVALKTPVILNEIEEKDLTMKAAAVSDSPSPSPSTTSTLKASGSSISRKSSVSPAKLIKEQQPSVKPKEKSIPKSEPLTKKLSNQTSPKTTNTDKILQETAAKIEKVESFILKKKEEVQALAIASLPLEKDDSFPLSPPMSPVSSVASSQATSPTRSRTCSESSNDNRPGTKGNTSRRPSKILSKAALFDNMLASGAKASPVVDKPKKSRPGALNMSDFSKKFEDKPNERKPKVVPAFKVSDARKAFEVKTDQSLENGRRRSSQGSSGRASQSISPKESLPTSPRESLPTSPIESLPTSPTESVPTSPLRPDKTFSLTEPGTAIIQLDDLKGQLALAGHESAPVKEISKKIVDSKSSSKDLKKSIKKDKSPAPSLVEKEVSPTPTIINKDKSSASTVVRKDKSPITSPVKKDKAVAAIKKDKSPSPVKTKDSFVQNKVGKVSSAPIEKKGEVKASTKQEPSVIVKRKVPSVSKVIDIKVETSDSSDSESEAEKMLRMLAEKRERLEKAKKERLKKASEAKEKDVQAINEERKIAPVPASSRIADKFESESKDQKSATLPRGFKSKAPVRPKPTWDHEDTESIPSDDTTAPRTVPPSGKRIPIVKEVVAISPEQVMAPTPREVPHLTNVNSFDELENTRKKTQMDIVLNQQPPKKQPQSKPLGPQKSFEIKISRENSKPEFRTEVEHIVNTPEQTHIEPQLQRARRERIIPIMMVDDSDSSPIQPSLSTSSKSSSTSSTRVTNFGMAPISSTLGSSAAAERNLARSHESPEPIKKSRRERIIPIAIEGEGIISPAISESASSEGIRGSFHRQGSGATSTTGRGRSFLLDRADSFSSAGEDDDEDEDDGFQFLTAESLFSTLLSRVRNLTRKMTDDGRPRRIPQANQAGAQDPNGFWSSLYSPSRDSPSRRGAEGLSRAQSKDDESFGGGFTSPMWTRNSMSRDGSDAESVFSDSNNFSTLPRADFLRHNLLLRHNKMFNDPFFSDFTRT